MSPRTLLACLAFAPPAMAAEPLLELSCADGPVATCAATNGVLTAVLVRAPTATWEADVVPVDREAAIPTLFADELCPESPAIIIGGYFGEAGDGSFHPLGLVVSDGAVLVPRTPWQVGGIIVVDADGTTGIRYWNEPDPVAAGAREALQSKPILVNGNANDGIADRASGWNRVAFGLTGGGDLVLAGVFTETGTGMGRGPTLAGFADWLAAVRFPDGAVIERAINLDGGSSANLYLRAEERLYGVTKPRYVPNVICLRPRHGS
jgi:hypothetical protein